MKKIGGFEKYNADRVHNFLLLIFTSSGHNACFHMDSTGEIYPVLFILCIIWCCKSLYDDLVWDKFFFFLAQESWPFIIGIIIIIILHVMWPETKCFVRIFFPFVFLWVGKKKRRYKEVGCFWLSKNFPSYKFWFFLVYSTCLCSAECTCLLESSHTINFRFSWCHLHACAITTQETASCIRLVLSNGRQCWDSYSRCHHWCLCHTEQYKSSFPCFRHAKLVWTELFHWSTGGIFT